MRALRGHVWLFLFVSTACRGAPSPTAPPQLQLTPCRIDWHGSGHADEVQCGTLKVFENRETKTGKTLPLRVARVPALKGLPKADPIFVLVGGPGQAATEHIPALVGLLSEEHRKRDLVFIDQRGTGSSGALDCVEPEDAGFEATFRDLPDSAVLHACLATYAAHDQHPALYTTAAAADDLDDVRAALGADQIDLWGVSYGTRLGFAYLRRHGAHVRSAVFDAVTPPTQSLLQSAAPDADRAFKLIFDACAKDPACDAAFPKLEPRFQALLTSLDQAPAHTTIVNPTTGATEHVTLTRNVFALGLVGLLYAPELSSILPLLIDRASKGDFQPFVTEAVALDLADDLSRGLFYSIICSEDARAATAASPASSTFIGDSFAAATLSVCSFWPRGPATPESALPVTSDVPVLLLSGELDPVTPPAHAAEAAKTLSHGFSLVVPGVGHGVSGRGCVPKLLSKFIDSAGTEPLDAACAAQLKRPPFFLSFAGPTP